jgi:hypothetical protein
MVCSHASPQPRLPQVLQVEELVSGMVHLNNL